MHVDGLREYVEKQTSFGHTPFEIFDQPMNLSFESQSNFYKRQRIYRNLVISEKSLFLLNLLSLKISSTREDFC